MDEAKFQQACYMWFHNTYPAYRGLLCCNLNNSKNKVDGALNRSKGVQPGRADMVFYWNGRAVHIELKTPNGLQSKAQKEWQKLIISQGFNYVIVRSLNEFKALIEGILGQNS
mgnify:CR=1 FL=1